MNTRLPVAIAAPTLRPGLVPQCNENVCITCSDTAVAVTVVRLLGDDLAIVDTGAGEEEVSVALVEAGAGDTILVHAKEAIAVVPPDGIAVVPDDIAVVPDGIAVVPDRIAVAPPDTSAVPR